MSLIQWTHETFNPTTGCDKTESRACRFCYAERQSERYQKAARPGYANGFNFTLQPGRLDNPKEWKTPKYIFTGSMSDLFHERCPRSYIESIFEVMNEADQHVYQLLTKRSERLSELGPNLPWDKHIWAGVSVGHPDFKSRIDDLRECGANVKWISAEPLVGPLGDVDLTGIDWMVFGGESGPTDPEKSNMGNLTIDPVDPDWIRDLIRQCREQGTTPFVKQLGERWANQSDADHSHGGDIFEWPQDLQIREMPQLYPGQPDLDTLPGIENL